MKPRAYYLRALSSAWSVYDLSERDKGGPIQPLAEGLDQQGVVRQLAEMNAEPKQAAPAHLVIGLPASWCLCATVSEQGLPRNSTAQQTEALNYRLEALLPITAEACAIDYVGPGPERLGIAFDGSRLKSLIHALEDAGHSVEAITPRAMLAAQDWLATQHPGSLDEPTSLCWLEDCESAEPGLCQLVHIDPGCPPRWRLIDNHADVQAALQQQLEIDGLDTPNSVRSWRAAPEIVAGLVNVVDQAIEPSALGNALEAEIEAARAIVNSTAQPWINLARGPLAARYHWRRLRVPAVAAAAALVMLLVSILVVFWFRGDAYDRVAEHYDTQSAEVFAQALPGQAVPTSPKRRLQARLKQLRGESGVAGGDALQTGSTPTLLLLHDLLDALPSDQRYAITDLRIEDGALRMTGYARTHSEADQIANTLRGSSVFMVEPPSTDNLREGGVRFALHAKHSPPEDAQNQTEQSPPNKPGETSSLAEHRQKEDVQ